MIHLFCMLYKKLYSCNEGLEESQALTRVQKNCVMRSHVHVRVLRFNLFKTFFRWLYLFVIYFIFFLSYKFVSFLKS